MQMHLLKKYREITREHAMRVNLESCLNRVSIDSAELIMTLSFIYDT